jgi:trk system potassium uptake protein TrkH
VTRPRLRWLRAFKPPARWRFSPWLGMTERRRSAWRRLTPPQLFVASFVGLVALGTLGLRLLPGLYTGDRLGWLDALFTATSAVCVTGLIVVDTATHFTFAGQLYLLVLIQLGGLGMITFTTLIILALGKRLSLRHERLSSAGAEVAPHVPIDRLTRDVVRFTVALELLGALALYVLWIPRLGWERALWPAVFHSVSAFCNAGFSTFSDSMIGFRDSPLTLLAITTLVVAGGIGFLTMEELVLWWRSRRGGRALRLSLHSRIVLSATAILLAAGWLLFGVFEWHNTLRGLDPVARMVNALFLSATPRTAGFNNIDYAAATESTNFLTIILMFVGGSPGSTAGGVKTTAVALVVLLAFERLRGREVPSLWGRSVPEETVQRAIGLSVVAFAVVTASIFALTWTEAGNAGGAAGVEASARFLARMFEAVSAFNTVGLSIGITSTLSDASKFLIALLMFVGRVGPLTFAAALAVAAQRGHEVSYRYAYEDVVVG